MRPALNPTRFGIEAEAGTAAADHRFSHEAMNTVFEVHCAHADATYAGQAAQAAFELVDRLEQDLSRFIANSDVSRIGRLDHGEQTRVSPWTMECLGVAGRAAHADRRGVRRLARQRDRARSSCCQSELTVRAHAGGVSIDLGGIGKGYAVDRMAELLEEWEIEQRSSTAASARCSPRSRLPDRDGWPLTLAPRQRRGPGPARRPGAIALSASGVQKGAHIVDPRTGEPVAGRAAWVALAIERLEPEDARRSAAALAEGLSTAFMILSEKEIESSAPRSRAPRPGCCSTPATRPPSSTSPRARGPGRRRSPRPATPSSCQQIARDGPDAPPAHSTGPRSRRLLQESVWPTPTAPA